MRILPLLLVAGLASADTITLDDGRVLDGKVEPHEDGTVTIRLEKAEMTLPGSRVRKVEPAPLPREAYAIRQREVQDTPSDRMALSRWCKAKGLDAEAKEQALAALALDAEYVEAREALGYRKVDGIWMSAGDRARLERKAPEGDRPEVVEGRIEGWTGGHDAIWVVPKESGWLDTSVRKILRVGVPLVTLEMRPTVASLRSMREVMVAGPFGAAAIIEAPVVSLTAVRTTAQVAAYR